MYQYDFFLHYFDHRYFHRKRFYDLGDSTRVVAKQVMEIVGNTKYRKVDFNEVVDSVAAILPDYPVEEYLDSVITDLNLEYLATGEIKVRYRKRKQKYIYAKYKPSDMERASLGNIKFYAMNRRALIEELDASQFDSLLPQPDSANADMMLLADSLDKLKIRMMGDTATIGSDGFQSVRDDLQDQLDNGSDDDGSGDDESGDRPNSQAARKGTPAGDEDSDDEDGGS